jgi:hypothetical protein
MSDPLVLTKPMTQDRLNAAVFECARLRMTGSIRIPGYWDALDTMDYFETRARAPIVRMSDSDFLFCDKHISFRFDRVEINPTRIEIPGPAFPVLSFEGRTQCSLT